MARSEFVRLKLEHVVVPVPKLAAHTDIEGPGETVRARVKAHSGVDLDWEIKRIGVKP